MNIEVLKEKIIKLVRYHDSADGIQYYDPFIRDLEELLSEFQPDRLNKETPSGDAIVETHG